MPPYIAASPVGAFKPNDIAWSAVFVNADVCIGVNAAAVGPNDSGTDPSALILSARVRFFFAASSMYAGISTEVDDPPLPILYLLHVG